MLIFYFYINIFDEEIEMYIHYLIIIVCLFRIYLQLYMNSYPLFLQIQNDNMKV